MMRRCAEEEEGDSNVPSMSYVILLNKNAHAQLALVVVDDRAYVIERMCVIYVCNHIAYILYITQYTEHRCVHVYVMFLYNI